MVNSARSIRVSRVMKELVVDSANTALPIRCISRWPAVMFAVSRTAKAIGWISRLIVSITTNMGMRGVGVPCGRR